jgi:hypothetical protein
MVALDYPHEAPPAIVRQAVVSAGYGRFPLMAPKGCIQSHAILTPWAKRSGITVTLWMCNRSSNLSQFEPGGEQ